MNDCERWIEHFEALETGEPVSADARAFLDDHAASCARCGAERAALASLRLPAHGASTAEDDALAAAVLGVPSRVEGLPSLTSTAPGAAGRAAREGATPRRSTGPLHADPATGADAAQAGHASAAPAVTELAARHEVAGRSTRSLRRRLVLGGSVALAAAALVALLVWPSEPPATPALFVVSRVSGEATLDGAPAGVGTPFTDTGHLQVGSGTACLEVATGGSFCFAAGSEARGAQLAGAERTVHLVRGDVTVTMQPQPPGVRTGVHTDDGVALAVGTRFQVTRDAMTRVRVWEGRVLTRRGSLEHVVEAGGEHELSATVATSPPPTEAVEPPRPTPAPTPQTLRPDTPHPPRPLVVPAPTPAPTPTPPPAEELLRDARALKREARPAEAARRYERLLELHPGTPEALAGLLALSELELSALSHPDRALLLVRRYLEQKGPLREEALLLQIRALQALGRAVEVTSKVEAFRREFPDSPHLEGLPR